MFSCRFKEGTPNSSVAAVHTMLTRGGGSSEETYPPVEEQMPPFKHGLKDAHISNAAVGPGVGGGVAVQFPSFSSLAVVFSPCDSVNTIRRKADGKSVQQPGSTVNGSL